MANSEYPLFQPDFLGKIGAIIKYFQNPCDAPWTVYFETAGPALGEAVLTLLDFGFDDVVRGALRPGGLRSNRHGRRGRRGGGLSKAIPEVGELLGAMIPGQKNRKARRTSNGVKNLWLLDGVIQRVLWYWLVADVTVTFAFNWTSAILESRFCEQQGAGAALSVFPEDAICFSVANAWTTPPAVIKIYETGAAEAFGGAHFNFGMPFSCSTTISGTRLPIFDEGFIEMRSIVGGVPGPIIESSVNADGEEQIVGVEHSFGEFVLFQVRTNGGGFMCDGQSFTMGG